MSFYDDLVAKCPSVFRKHPYCGFDLPEGWEDLMEELCEALEPIFAANEELSVGQVKEKFGGLRFYIDGYSDEAEKAIHAAEIKSTKTCQFCGEPGTLISERGWWMTICKECEEE